MIIFLTDIMSNSRLDKNLFNLINKINKKKIYLLNKVDLLKENFPFYKDYSLKNFLHISVKTQYNIESLFNLIKSIFFND
ncbi:MAG TPA: hypothetical protein ACYCC8_00515, partial [Candidatus Azoamicus sp.]